MSRLYVTATPIGNLGDLSPRALETLRNVGLIISEDTRVTRRLMNAFDIHAPLLSSHRHNESSLAGGIAERILNDNIDAALVTDAGTPGISDPGWALVERCREAGIEVMALPGPCAAAAAVSVSGFEVKEFAFYGFLPREKKPLAEKLRSIATAGMPGVIYESPLRIKNLMEVICQTLPDARVCLCAEMTKMHERSYWGRADKVLERLRADENAEKGEYCLVLDPGEIPQEPRQAPVSPEALIFERLLQGDSLKEAREAVGSMIGKNPAYAASLKVKDYLNRYAEGLDG